MVRKRWRGRAGVLARWGVLAGVVAGSLVAVGGSAATAGTAGFETAFQANTANLWTYGTDGGVDTAQGMMAGTSPADAELADGSYEEAFQANTGDLYIRNSSGATGDTGLGMMHGTSPAITALAGGGFEIAFQANTGDLYVYSSASGPGDTGLGMAAGTSPAITAPPTTSTIGAGNCGPANSCTPQTFADALLSYPGVNAPVTASNEFAIEAWEAQEGGGAGCPGQPAYAAPWASSPGPAGNPLNTTQPEPGSTPWNTVPHTDGVQIYADADGETCWDWGITANGTALTNGDYGAIINVLQNPSPDDYTQCVDLANAVAPPGDPAGDVWGTANFSALC